MIAIIAAAMGASVQGITKPLMETHKVSLCVFLAAIIVHYIAFAADKWSQHNQVNPSQFWGLIGVIFGSLSTVSLVSTFFTHSVAEIICYIALGCAAIIIVVYQYGSMFTDACHSIYQEILSPFFDSTLNWFQDNNINSTEQQQGSINEEV